MENKGLTAYKSDAFVDRRYFLNPNFFDSELLTIVKAKYVNEDLVVEFQKVNGRSVLYTFIDEHAKREFIADVVGYFSSNPHPQSFMKPENMFGKRVEGFFDRSDKRLVSVAPIFPYCNDKKYRDNLGSRVLNEEEGKKLSENNPTDGLDKTQDSTPYNPGHPWKDWPCDPNNLNDPDDPNLHGPEYPWGDNLLEDEFGS